VILHIIIQKVAGTFTINSLVRPIALYQCVFSKTIILQTASFYRTMYRLFCRSILKEHFH